MRAPFATLLVLSAAACGGTVSTPVDAQTAALVTVDSAQLVEDLRYLSAPGREGRAAGSAGNEEARQYIVERLSEIGVEPLVAGNWLQRFDFGASPQRTPAANVVGAIQGSDRAAGVIVISAHYDHLGRRGGQIYPGADDNASGVAALLDAARHFSTHPPRHTLVFLATDAEEQGLVGARYFVDNPPVELDRVVLDINLDMVSRSDVNELYVAGRSSGEGLAELIADLADIAEVDLIPGHDRETPQLEDWTGSSDHGPFSAAGIPWLYFGVEDHPDYHQPTDLFEHIDQAFLLRSVRTILTAIELADQRL